MAAFGEGNLLFSDEFTYSDGALATVGSAKWLNPWWGSQASIRVVSNEVHSSGGAWEDAYTIESFDRSHGIDLIARGFIAATSSSTSTFAHILGTPGTNPSGYYISVNNITGTGNDIIRFGKNVNGSATPLIAVTQEWVDGDDLGCRIEAGGTCRLYYRPAGGSWTEIGTAVTDNAYSSGICAVECFDAVSGYTAVEVRDTLTPGEPIPPSILWGTIAASVDASAPYTVTGTLPSHQTDDILIACAAQNDASDLTCGTSGWATMAPAQNNGSFSTAWFWKRATSGAETAPVITSSRTGGTTSGIYVTCARIRDCIVTGTPFEDATLAGAPTTDTTPDSSLITTTGPNRLAVAVALIDDNNTISNYPPALWSAGVNTSSATGGDSACVAISRGIPSAGDVSAVAICTQSASDYWKTLTLAFIPEPVASASRLKRWNGSAWAVANLKKHNGSIWVPANLKKF